MNLLPDLSRRHRPFLAAALGAAALAAVPAPAGAKTFVASFEDETGDAAHASHDVVHARVAYNRRTGAISTSVQMDGEIVEQPEDAVVLVILSNLQHGKCTKAAITLGAPLSDPSVPVSWLGFTPSKRRWLGSGNVDGSTLNMRVRAKSLSGKHPGCAVVLVTPADQSGQIIDQTAGNDGFA